MSHARRVRLLASAIVLALLLAGCQAPPPAQGDGDDGSVGDGSDGGSGSTLCASQPVGDLTSYEYVGQLVQPDGQPRYRIPGTTSHAEAACWLWNALHVDGWQASWQNFTGEQYMAHDKGAVAGYAQAGQGHCSQEEAQRLADLHFYNLVATRPGDGTDDRTVLLGAHWDSKHDASEDPDPAKRDQPVLGANDGGSGVGVLLALQRSLPPTSFAVTLVFFDAEDGFEDCHPLAGSIHFARTMGDDPVDRMILLDMVGDSAARFPRESRSVQSDPALVDLVWSHAANSSRADNFVEPQRPVLDDHIPFIEEGVPSIDIIDYARPAGEGNSGFPPYWHTTGDTLDKLDPDMMADMVDLMVAVLTDPAFTAQWPA